ncbi:MAG: ABC transporter permease [Gemmatimonadaceae bacterium]|nr:ABC transporter permease [Gemmatimonadaceae bacterium]
MSTAGDNPNDRPLGRGAPDRIERTARAFHRALLRAYPRDFREEFGLDMDETFADRWRDARSRGEWAIARLLIGSTVDAARTAVATHLRAISPPRDMLHLQDLRHAVRLLRRTPAFTLLTLFVLAGGMGVSIFTFSFLYTAIVRPIPLSDGARMVRVQQRVGGSVRGIDAVDLATIRPQLTMLSAVGGWMARDAILGDDNGTSARRVIEATAVEWSTFDLTRTPPAMGRAFRADDERPGAAPVIVLGHRLWQVAFGGDRGIIGRRIVLDGTATEVIGVMPSGFAFPVAAESWVPLGAAVRTVTERGHYTVNVFARLASGATRADAEREVEVLLQRAWRDRPVSADSAETSAGGAPRALVRTFPMAQMGDEGPVVFTLLNLMAALILLLACVNVANLLLARANERAREMAVRLALGASRARLAVQALWEPVILVAVGGTMATALAAWGLDVVNAWAQHHLEGNLAFWWVWRMDGTTLLAAGGFMTATLAALGGVMAVRATGTRYTAVLRDGARSGLRGAGRAARLLVATQVATVTVLMFFGVLSAVAARTLERMNPGYDTRNLLASGIDSDADRQGTPAQRRALWSRLYDGLGARPEIEDRVLRARIGALDSESGALEFGDGRTHGADARPRAWVYASLGALDALGIATVEGRQLLDSDRDGQPLVALVSRSLARSAWPGRSAIGERLRLPGTGERAEDAWRTVVGVAEDVQYGEEFSRNRGAEAVYVPLAQHDAPAVSIAFRHRGDATAAQAALHATFAAIDPRLAPSRVTTYDEVLEKSALIANSVTRLFALCFGFALLLAVSGTYGVMSRAMALRVREIGIRRALGAPDASIRRLLLGQGARQLGVGAIVALPLMLMVGLAFSRFFPLSPWIASASGFAVSSAIVAVVLAASWIPARRALGVPPQAALASE